MRPICKIGECFTPTDDANAVSRRSRLIGWLVGATIVAVFVPMAQADFDDGLAAYEQGDYATAFKEFKTLAEQGNADGQYKLGMMYSNGDGVPHDAKKAEKWIRSAAEQGSAAAQNHLGVMYHQGQGARLPQDHKEAASWYRKAAEQGNALGQSNLGEMYAYGRGVPQHYILAHMWLNLAAAQGIERARKERDIVAEKMTHEQIAEAQELAREWKPKE